MTLRTAIGAALATLGLAGGCEPLNSPYPAADAEANILYRIFSEAPKNLDTAVSYNSNEYMYLWQICEPPLEYHYLKRPYALKPRALVSVPEPLYYDAEGRPLPDDAPPERIARVVYECRLRKGMRYQDHPCFAKTPDGRPLYVPIDPDLAARVESPNDFPVKATREVVADDYVYAVKRLANPLLTCPILTNMADSLLGLDAYAKALAQDLADARAQRRAAAGPGYIQEDDERAQPIRLDLDRHPFPGVERVDRYTFRLVLKRKYPQILYWLAMPFFSPVPPEADAFYAQAPLIAKSITLRRWPVGSGPFFMARFEPNRAIVLARNPNFREDPYPSEGEPGDAAAGLLADAGRPMPFVDRVIHVLEKEPISAWNKFLQGYYDISESLSADTFESAITVGADGAAAVTPLLADKGIAMHRDVETAVMYIGFNMHDPVVGGYDEKRCKLRQAVNIAIDTEERIQIFLNGRGIPAMSPIPPGIFGFEEGPEGINPYCYSWDAEAGQPRRRSLDEARRLLAEAGYPGGIGPDGKQLVIGFDNAWNRPDLLPVATWLARSLDRIGIHLEVRTTDYNRFQEKMQTGNFQMFTWGWFADYPDPENFLFLLYGPNGRASGDVSHAETAHVVNHANYASPHFDALFKRFEAMENGPERLALIREMVRLLQHDAPWVAAFHPVTYSFTHAWHANHKPFMGNTQLKFLRIDPIARAAARRAWNRPRWTPLLLFGGGLTGLALWTWLSARRTHRAGAP